jgi:hypothetical protein
MLSRALFLLTRSLAFLAASLALADFKDFSTMAFAVFGFSSQYMLKASPVILSTIPLS